MCFFFYIHKHILFIHSHPFTLITPLLKCLLYIKVYFSSGLWAIFSRVCVYLHFPGNECCLKVLFLSICFYYFRCRTNVILYIKFMTERTRTTGCSSQNNLLGNIEYPPFRKGNYDRRITNWLGKNGKRYDLFTLELFTKLWLSFKMKDEVRYQITLTVKSN